VNAGAAALAALLLPLPASADSGRLLIGGSVEGRRIDAVELGDRHSSKKLLVVGCIHGNECAGARPESWPGEAICIGALSLS
jgi:hypothetical protein